MLMVAARTFAIDPLIGSEGLSLSHARVSHVFSPLKTTLLLLDDGRTRCCLITTHFEAAVHSITILLRRAVAHALGLPVTHVLFFSSHNHCSVSLSRTAIPLDVVQEETPLGVDELSAEGTLLLQEVARHARRLPDELAQAQVRLGIGSERRITYVHKGRRADGTTFLMREEDRLRQGADYHGDIDDTAAVVGFYGEANRPLAFLTHFTGHPATAYHSEYPVVFGEYPQVAGDDLSAAHGGIPVAFLQGCCGDVCSKGLVSGKPVEEGLADATRYGHALGDTYRLIAERLQPSRRDDLALLRRQVRLPFRPVPPRRALLADLAEMDAFLARCAAGEVETTRRCAGLNFAETHSPRYRALLIEPVRRWTTWALRFHEEGRLADTPAQVTLEIALLRIGDVAICGLPCEPFQGIGRLLRALSPTPLTLPCGYMDDYSVGYIPDSGNNGDREYMSTYYRYTTCLLPYRQPAGDRLARAAARAAAQSLQRPYNERGC